MTMMEVPDEKEICSCGPKLWTRIIGWLQISFIVLLGIGATAGIFIPTFLAISDPSAGDKEGNVDEKFISTGLGVVILWVVTGLSTLVVALLIVGNEKERTSFLWPWLMVQWVTTLSSGLGAIVALFTVHIWMFLSMTVQALLGGFFLYVVHQRRKEILATEAQTTVGGYQNI